MQFAEPRQRVCHLERERNHRREFPTVNRPHQTPAVPQPRRHRRGRHRGEQRKVQRVYPRGDTTPLAASSNASAYRSASRSSAANVRTVLAPANRSAATDAARPFAAAARPCARGERAPRVPKSATPGGTIPSATAEISHEMRNRDAAAVRGDGDGFDTAGELRATTSDTCATSEPKRSRVSPLVRRSIPAVSSVMSAAKRRLRRFVSIAVEPPPTARARKYFARPAPRSAASSRSGRSGTPPGAGGAGATRGFDEIVEAGHVSHRGHLEGGTPGP